MLSSDNSPQRYTDVYTFLLSTLHCFVTVPEKELEAIFFRAR